MTDDTHIYYDISIFNNDTSGDMPVNLAFTEQRSGGSLIENPQDYYFSIVRFELDTPDLPVFIPQNKAKGTANVNDLIYEFALETLSDIDGSSLGIFKARVQYSPTNPNLPVPDSSQDNFSHEYYHVYNFKRWIDMVNTCFETIFTGIQATHSAHLNSTAKAPFFSYDASSGLVSLYTTAEYEDGGGTFTTGYKRLNIYWNSPTQTIFSGFDTIQATTAKSATIDSKAPVNTGSHVSTFYKFKINNRNNKNRVNLGITNSPAYFIKNTQAHQSLPMCSPIQNIVSSTGGNVPVSNSQIANPVIFSSEGDCSTQGGADNISPILTDFIVPLMIGNEYKPKINYSPSEYRLLDLKGNTPLKSCDLQVFWKSKVDSKLHPFILGSQCGASCKIMFRKKQFNNIF